MKCECPNCEERSIEISHNGTVNGINFYECHRCNLIWHAANPGLKNHSDFYNLELVDKKSPLDSPSITHRVEAYHIHEVYNVACQMLGRKRRRTVVNYWLKIQNGILCLYEFLGLDNDEPQLSRHYVTIREAYEIEPDILALTIHGNDPYDGVVFTGEDEHDVLTQAGEWIRPRWNPAWGEMPEDVEDYLGVATGADGVYRYSLTKVIKQP